jgi:hypothetical protein
VKSKASDFLNQAFQRQFGIPAEPAQDEGLPMSEALAEGEKAQIVEDLTNAQNHLPISAADVAYIMAGIAEIQRRQNGSR